MSYGADLNNAFGTSFENTPSHVQQTHQMISTPIAKLQTIPPNPSQPPQPPTVSPPPIVQNVRPITRTSNVQRRETIKIITYALIILFALALYSVFEMIIKEIVIGNDLGYKQEIAIRLIYPLLVFFILWNVRNFMP